jgi:hypothetical protein
LARLSQDSAAFAVWFGLLLWFGLLSLCPLLAAVLTILGSLPAATCLFCVWCCLPVSVTTAFVQWHRRRQQALFSGCLPLFVGVCLFFVCGIIQRPALAMGANTSGFDALSDW